MRYVLTLTTRPIVLAILTLVLSHGGVAATEAGEWTRLDPDANDGPPTVDVSRTSTQVLITAEFPGFATKRLGPAVPDTVELTIPQCGRKGAVGEPAMPFRSVAVPVARGLTVEKVTIDAVGAVTLPGITVAPVEAPQTDSPHNELEDGTAGPDPYLQDRWYPNQSASIVDDVIVRGRRFLLVEIFPIRFNPVRREIIGHQLIEVTVALAGTVDEAAHELAEQRVSPLVGSPFTGRQLLSSPLPTGVEYLIVAGDSLVTSVEPLAAWKRRKGLTAEIVPMSAIGTSSEDLRTFLEHRYTSDPDMTYVLFVGAHNLVPSTNMGGWYSDHPYSCIDGDDYLPDVILGRLSVSTVAECDTVVEKILGYEQTPSTGEWHRNFLMAALLQDYNNFDCTADRWFFETATHVTSFLDDEIGMEIHTAANSDNSSCSPYYWRGTSYSHRMEGYSGQPVPSESAALLTGSSQATQDVIDAINSGVGLVLHRDHGATYGWGDPPFTVSHVSTLTNGNQLPVVFSINCLTGAFAGSSRSFAEALVSQESGGAVGVVAASEVSYSGYNDLIARGLIDSFWDDYDPDSVEGPYPHSWRPAEALAYSKYYMHHWMGSNSYTEYQFRLFHWFGDPEMMLMSDVPTNPLVTRSCPLVLGTTELTLTGGVEGALVAVHDDGTLIGRGTVSDGLVSISLDPPPEIPTTLDLLMTGHNMIPWQDTCEVIAPEGPWISHIEHSVDDSGGNGDGILNPGETAVIQVRVENIGAEPGTEVAAGLSSSSPFVVATDSSCDFPDLATGETAWSNPDHVAIEIGADTPHATVLPFNLDWTTGEGSTGTTRFSSKVCAALEISDLVVDQISDTAARISWSTNVPSAAALRYGTTSPPANTETRERLSTSHSYEIVGLEPCSAVYFTAVAESPGCYRVENDDSGHGHRFQTLRRVVEYDQGFEDGTNGWTADEPWSIVEDPADPGNRVWTDSPDGQFKNRADVSLYSPVLDLSDSESLALAFRNQYDLGSSALASIEASTDGSSWNTVETFTGIQSDWTTVRMDLAPHSGSPVFQLRFRLLNEGGQPGDGWYVDDLQLYSRRSCSLGSVSLEREIQLCGEALSVHVRDGDLNIDPSTQDSATVVLTSDSEPGGEVVTVAEQGISSSHFLGSIVTTTDPATGDGLLSVANDDSIVATYTDLDPGDGQPAIVEASARADCLPPVITDLHVSHRTGSTAAIDWTTNEPSDSSAWWDSASPPTAYSTSDGRYVTSHSLLLTGMEPCSSYFFYVESADLTGQSTTSRDTIGISQLTTASGSLESVRGNGVPADIPDNDAGGVRSILRIGSPWPIADVDVMVNIEHTYASDVHIQLVAPNGTTTLLAADNGGDGDGFAGTVFDDEASTPIGSGSPPFDGGFRPVEPLAALDGILATGEWSLFVRDDSPFDTGSLIDWELRLELGTPCDVIFADGFELSTIDEWSATHLGSTNSPE